MSLVDAVFQWCEFTRGNCDPDKALGAVTLGLNASAASLSRLKAHGNTSSIHFDTLEKRSTLPRLDMSYSARLLSGYVACVRPGSLWLRSQVETEKDPDLDRFYSRRGFVEFGVIPLSSDQGITDFIELHFAQALTPEQHALLNTVSGTLSSAWRARASGLFVEAVLERKRRKKEAPSSSRIILGMDNPYKLSRMEFRVCVCLSRGLSKEGVIDELGISQSTFRTHLRNIYGKTNVDNLAQLVFALLDQPAPRVTGAGQVA